MPVAVVVVACSRAVPETRDPHTGRPLDLTGAAVAVVTLASATWALTEAGVRGWTDGSVLAAGSVVVLLLWVYYTSQIVLVGAEFTRLHADRDRGVVPAETFAEPVGPPPGSVEAQEPVA